MVAGDSSDFKFYRTPTQKMGTELTSMPSLDLTLTLTLTLTLPLTLLQMMPLQLKVTMVPND